MSKKIIISTVLILIFVGIGFFVSQKGLSVSKVKAEDIVVQQEQKTPAAPISLKAVYLTEWSGASKSKINYVIRLAREVGVNAVVIDIKDWSGRIPYNTGIAEAKEYGAERVIISDISQVIKDFHDAGIYVIARMAVFQDPVLASAREDLAVRRKSDGKTWLDYKGIAWIDPSKEEAWDYNINIAKDAILKGFDEINFDYIRFPSDGNLKDIDSGNILSESGVINGFFKYLRESMPNDKLSVDLFGLSTVNRDDLGIGQIIEDSYRYFDYVCPMVYPSHYADGFMGFDNPAEHPFEVVAYSMAKAAVRLEKFKKDNPETKAMLRPWLQDFNMGSVYNGDKILLQIMAAKLFSGENYAGYMLWSPTNFYSEDAILKSKDL